MTLAYLFLFLAFVSMILFFYFLHLYCFSRKKYREFEKRKLDPEYPEELEREHKGRTHKEKKNLILYLAYRSLLEQGKEERAKALFPFLKDSHLFGIKKGSA